MTNEFAVHLFGFYVTQIRMVLLYVIAAVILLGIAFVAWGAMRLRKKNAEVANLFQNLKIGDVNLLVAEAKERLLKVYGKTIDLNDPEAAAKTISDLFNDTAKLQGAFSKKTVSWYFVFPIGALTGEYVRIHAGGVWKSASNGLFMEIPVKDGTATCYPFDKVLKQFDQGDKGDMYAFLISSAKLSSLVTEKSSHQP